MLFFLTGRTFFLLYHFKPLRSYQLSEILLSYVYGLKLDISFTSYISILPAAVLPILLVFNARERIIRLFLQYYTGLWIVLLALLFTIDAELFSFWGFRLDNTIFRYNGTPAESVGSALSSPLWLLFPVLFIYIYLAFRVYKKYISPLTFSALKVYWLPVTLFMAALFVIPIRGGLQQIPINESVSYYSRHAFLNQAALNPAWTLAR
ncbi:MAG: LTA synthase family protein, partial [Cytophagales bacterium]|nr:LTA synthase family protein [Cytophaga sp.]